MRINGLSHDLAPIFELIRASLGETSEDYRKSFASSHAKIMKGIANSGLDTAALSRRVQDILRTDELQTEEETAPPAQGKPRAKRKSQRLH